MPKDQLSTPEVIATEVPFVGRIWNIVRETFNYNGSPLVREFVQHPGAVAILAIDELQRVLLIRQYRHPVRSYLWEIPAGLLDVPGEPRIDAAKRELLEETGYEAETWSELTSFMTTPGGNDEVITVFLAQDLKHVGHNLELEGEETDMLVEWFPLQEALDSVLSAEMRSPSAVVGIMSAAFQLGVLPSKL
jgi:8-oxo-dGTP pyrophosphatase MutT (NUDIX family)